jgi:tRNA-Thr(GGU) m(6)t(6)A37 methyltransferase TsaA
MSMTFQLYPVGKVRKRGESSRLEIDETYQAALLGMDCFSHIIVLCWFHQNDSPKGRDTLRVHPRGDRSNPLSGVFATRSPQRPNLMALYTCKITSIKDSIIHVDEIDAFDETPIIDIKPYIPQLDSFPEATVPPWVKKITSSQAQ